MISLLAAELALSAWGSILCIQCIQQSKAGIFGPQGRMRCETAVQDDAAPDGEREDRERMRRGQPKKVLPLGQLPLEHLRSLLRHLPKHDPRLLIGPQIGEDAAVIDAGDRYLVVTIDPITFATDHIGRYAVHVNANDVAVLGARPLWFFVVMLLPESRTTLELAETIMADVRTTCEELGVTLGGGHTEITQGLDRPILVGQMLGEVAPTRLVRKTRIAIYGKLLVALLTEKLIRLGRDVSPPELRKPGVKDHLAHGGNSASRFTRSSKLSNRMFPCG